MYPYEGMFLLDPVQHAADTEAVEKGVIALLEKHGAKIHQNERWDERKLAYEIKGHKRGVYLLTYFDMPGENVDAMRRECRITETILRQMVIRLDWPVDQYLEKQAHYYEKMREDQERFRAERDRGRGEEDTPPPPPPPAATTGAEA